MMLYRHLPKFQSVLALAARSKYKKVWPEEYNRVYKPQLTAEQLEVYRNLKIDPSPAKLDEKASLTEMEKLKRVYPELVPHNIDPRYRDPIRERLERQEMLSRRRSMNIPEFYVGSILQVTQADAHSPTKTHTFMGICIMKTNEGLWSKFVLRNVVDKTALEYTYNLYCPKLQSIKVLLLEKRLDDNLLYLRDAPLEESRIPQDLTPVPHSSGAPVPVNPKKVKLLPRPWVVEWPVHGYRGIDEESMYLHVPAKRLSRIQQNLALFERYDLVRQYRKSANIDDQCIAMATAAAAAAKTNQQKKQRNQKVLKEKISQ